MLARRRFLSTAAAVIALPAIAQSQGLELVMVEEHGCPWCARWNAEVGEVYHKTDEGRTAPLRRLDIREVSPDRLRVESRVVFTPTFILARDGAEIARIEGYPGEELFWWRLTTILAEHVTDSEGENG